MQCKIRVIKEILDIVPECRPEVGKVYDARYEPGKLKAGEVAIVVISDKYICLRKGEFEIVEG